jgi:hypothetical protein
MLTGEKAESRALLLKLIEARRIVNNAIEKEQKLTGEN